MAALNLNFTLTPPQKLFMRSDKKFKLFCSGVGGGKTSVGWMSVLNYVFKNPGSTGVIIAPTYQSLSDVILRERPRWLPDVLIKSYNRTEKIMVLINGSTILFRSANDEAKIERLRGLTISWFWIDEATLLKKSVLDIMLARLRQPGYEPSAWLTCTPRWNWVHDLAINPPDEWFILDNINSNTNTFLPDGYINTLGASYTGQFYDQEVLGKWVVFEGLVYNLLVGEFPDGAKPSKIIYGLDWGWQDQTAIVVIYKLSDKLYIVSEHYQSYMTNDMIIDELKAKMSVFGSGDVFCDPSAAATISALKKGGIAARKANNKRGEGIRITNNFVNGKMFVSESCVNLLSEGKQYVYDGPDDKTSGMDHLCFIAGTMIHTEFGDIPIECIQAGDMVLTRKGYMNVKGAFNTGVNKEVHTVYFSDGGTLTGTPNHPIWVNGKGFIPLDTLRYGDEIQCIKTQLYSMRHFLPGIQNQTEETLTPIIVAGIDIYIEKCGKMKMVKFPPGAASTIKTGIHLTTNYLTLYASQVMNTCHNTAVSIIETIKKQVTHILIISDRLLKYGINPKPVGSGIVNTGLMRGSAGNISLKNVLYADLISSQETTDKVHVSVQTNANHNIDGITNLTMLKNSVQYVQECSSQINTAKQKHALRPVKVSHVIKQLQRQNVYNLVVDREHEYFANGVLVSNCDALRYACCGDVIKTVHEGAGVVSGR